ncbi:MAG: NAD-dependent epimerase/dehydratase family protein [Elusimicrobia bacterium]|nr:NAD-dependent epimerase/dehydratase family protein [Elusimicrobiota bacterium]
MKINNGFWKDKRVLITGFEGFLGSNLTKTLLGTKAKIIGLDIRTVRKDTIFSRADYGRIKSYKGSVTNFKLLREILRKHSINVIFHLAAEAIVSRSHKDPLRAFDSNIAGTWRLLEAARGREDMNAIVVASSDKAYGSHKKLPYRENAPLIADHPYDVSKSCADLIAYTYYHTYGLPVVVTRCGNIYGPGDFNFTRLMPDAMRCISRNRTLKIRSDGKFVRDYVYVDDIVSGYIRIAELLKARDLMGQAYNLSDENPLTVMQVLKEINALCGNSLKYRIMNSARYEIKKQYLSSRKAREELQWKPGYTIKEGLRKTIDWYLSYFKNKA